MRGVFFDIGGVVVKAELERYVDFGARVFDTSVDEFRDCAQALVPLLDTGAITSEQFWDRLDGALQARGCRAVPARKFKGFWRGLLEQTAQLDYEVLSLCRQLRHRVFVGALSNTIQEHAELLVSMGAYEPFQLTVLSFQVGLRKPDPEIYRLAARRAKLKPKECLFIDDSPEYVAAAEAVGMRGLLYSDVRTLQHELAARRLL